MVLILILSIIGFSFARNEKQSSDTCNILFLGNSYFVYNSFPDLVENLALASDKLVHIDHYMQGGYSLHNQVNSSAANEKINSKNWNFVVVIGSSASIAYPDNFYEEPVYQALIDLKNIIHNNNESTKLVYCLPWAYEDGMIWYGWPDDYSIMQTQIYENTLEYSAALDFTVAPVGWAWNTVLEEEDFPLHYLHLPDWSHPRLSGSYLAACAVYSTIYLETTVGNSYDAGLTEEDALNFQTVASSIVLDYLDLWNITSINQNPEVFTNSTDIYLHQNSPNPFSSSTQIKFDIKKKSKIEICVYNELGKKQLCLLNEEKLPGNYTVTIKSDQLRSGIYYYQISNGQYSQVRKMILLR